MFPPMLVGAAVAGTASALNFLHHYRQQLGPMTVAEARKLAAMEPTPIAEAQRGLVKLIGKVGSMSTVAGYYHREPCAVVELHHYVVVDSRAGPRRVLVRKESKLQPFWIEDETGRLAIDPARARIDFEVEGSDLDSTIEEHKLRIGERVAVLGVVRRTGPKLAHPMRVAATDFDSNLEFTDPPLVTWRSEPEVYPRLAPPFAGMALSAGSIGMAVLGAVLNL